MCNRSAMRSHWARHHHARKAWKRNHFIQKHLFPPVNVEELDDMYEISIFAAGYGKSDYLITIVDDTLNVSAKKVKSDDEGISEPKSNWQKREFKPQGFERRFLLNEKIDKEALSAKFEDGVVKITLPKLSGFETVRKEVEIK